MKLVVKYNLLKYADNIEKLIHPINTLQSNLLKRNNFFLKGIKKIVLKDCWK